MKYFDIKMYIIAIKIIYSLIKPFSILHNVLGLEPKRLGLLLKCLGLLPKCLT